jgi:hypothetical protein
MNTACKSLVAIAVAALLPACASTPRADLAAAPRQAGGELQSLDSGYVEAVERASRTAGVRVVWVNPPRKSPSED